MLEALEKTLGVVTAAAKSVGIHRTLHYKWMETHPDYKEAVDGIQDIVLDFAESKLYELVKNSEPSAVYFLLKTKGKARGYIEKQQHDITSGGEKLELIFKMPEK